MVCNVCRAQIFVRRIMDTDAYHHPWTTHDNRRYAFFHWPCSSGLETGEPPNDNARLLP